MNRIITATREDKEEILSLYKTMLYGPADWNEYYPNEDTIEFDLSRNALYVMKNEEDQIIAAISIDEDKDVDMLSCWSRELVPSAEVARLCVRKDMQNQGIAKEMMQYTKNNVLLQAAQSMLAQANQSSSNVLSLLQ